MQAPAGCQGCISVSTLCFAPLAVMFGGRYSGAELLSTAISRISGIIGGMIVYLIVSFAIFPSTGTELVCYELLPAASCEHIWNSGIDCIKEDECTISWHAVQQPQYISCGQSVCALAPFIPPAMSNTKTLHLPMELHACYLAHSLPIVFHIS